MKRKELTKTFMMISKWKNPLVFMVFTKKYFSIKWHYCSLTFHYECGAGRGSLLLQRGHTRVHSCVSGGGVGQAEWVVTGVHLESPVLGEVNRFVVLLPIYHRYPKQEHVRAGGAVHPHGAARPHTLVLRRVTNIHLTWSKRKVQHYYQLGLL